MSVAVTALRHRRSARGPARSVTARCCACWRNATPTSATTAPGSCAGCTRCWSSSPRAGSPRKSTLLTSTRSSPRLSPATPVEQIRYDLAVELLDDIRRLDAQLKASHKRIRTAVAASGTTLTDLFGIGPIIAAMLIGYTGDITRFARPRSLRRLQRHRPGRVLLRRPHRAPGVASAATGNSTTRSTWPRSARSATRTPTAAPTSTARSPRARPRREAIRALKRQISNAVYRQLVIDARRTPQLTRGPGGQREATRQPARPAHIPTAGSSARSLPDPPQRYAPPPRVDRARRTAHLTQRGFVLGRARSVLCT